jgi:DNA-binding beta-propeller fold protein YncE
MLRSLFALAVALSLIAPLTAFAQTPGYELWVVDQADANRGGARLLVYPNGSAGGRQTIDLDATSRGVGDGPGTRPHLLLFNNRGQSHALLAWVASGHVTFIRSADRRTVASIDVGEQAHGALAAPDDSFVLVANQNGKKLARIRSDFAREQFSWERNADFDLRAIEDAAHPDNAPICPIVFADNRKAYVTVRGGGLYVMDVASTPMRVLRQYPKEQVAAAGCGGVLVGNKMYVNSGTATFGALYVFDTRTDELTRTIDTTRYGTDAHGMVVVGRYLWMANRGEGDNMVVIDTQTDEVVGTFAGFGIGPDLMDLSPAGDRVFMTLRGPNNLTGGAPAKGETPGFAALSVLDGGRSGARAAFVPIGAQTPDSPADPHALAVRRALSLQVTPTQLPRTGGPPIELLAGLGATLLVVGLLARRSLR